jgi:potassium-transporting ATPase potassium-binding subunit
VDPVIQITVLFGGSLGAAVLFGFYIARMISYEMRPLEKPLAKIENGFFRLIGIDVNQQMTWKEYLFALLLTDGIVAIIIFVVFLIQNILPTATPGLKGLSVDLAFNTAISFITNTDLQHYAGDRQLSILSQMIAITFPMFIAPASAMAAGFAFIRAFIRKNLV